jgi:hypothetical protein
MSLRNLITPVVGFQTAINIALDLNDEAKIRMFIPTAASVEVIGDILLSTHPKATQRAQILIGAYGRGKSHIVLVLLALLRMKNSEGMFDALLAKMREHDSELARIANDYLKSKRKLLPVVVRGSNATLSQAFLNALQVSLADAKLEYLVPQTHFQAARNAIEKWRSEYQDTFKAFVRKLVRPLDAFLLALDENDAAAYERFVELYPALTSGSVFNPFIGFDVPELYGMVACKVKDAGYDGLYVVYDEFSKFLESSIATATVSDTKMLQDFAEKCNRSGETALHLMLICHKDIANYIDRDLPKDKVDGWRGVSGRFLHVNLHNNFSQVYEIIATVLQKDNKTWMSFHKNNRKKFEELGAIFTKSRLFETHEATRVIEGCYPLHPLSTFILPRISERVAQNERTLFTFLAAHEKRALSTFLETAQGDFPLLTADVLYDYFEPLLKKEPYASEAHKLWRITESALRRVVENILGEKIIKVIALIYLVEQFEKLPPTVDVVTDMFRWGGYDEKAVFQALKELREKDCVVYLKRSNNYLRIKESSGVDIRVEVAAFIEKNRAVLTVKDILNRSAFDNCLYPVRYNDENDITRYFDFVFVSGKEVISVSDWSARLEATPADGIVYAVVPKDASEAKAVRKAVCSIGKMYPRILFAVPEHPISLESVVFEFDAVRHLKEDVADDLVLRDEYDIWLDDLSEVVRDFIAAYTHPGNGNIVWWHGGQEFAFTRKSQLSEKLSVICEVIYTKTPRINNESINKNTLSGTARKSRAKILTGLLANQLSPNLGLVGSGQDVSMMRSVLVVTEILKDPTIPVLNLEPPDVRMCHLLRVILDFFNRAAKRNLPFTELYATLTHPKYGIGLKRGVIPVFVAVVLYNIKRNLVILRSGSEVRITADLLADINDNPGDYTVKLEDWNDEKLTYLMRLEDLFVEHVIEAEKCYNSFVYITFAIKRWYMSLPKYAKELQPGSPSGKNKAKFIASLRHTDLNPREYLFETLPEIFGKNASLSGVADAMAEAKTAFDGAVHDLLGRLADGVRTIFNNEKNLCSSTKSVVKEISPSLTSVIKDWHCVLKPETCQHLFDGGENRILELMVSVTHDESAFLQLLAKAVIGLRVEDWNNDTITVFLNALEVFKEKIETFDKNKKSLAGTGYRLVIAEKDGQETVKSFPQTKTSRRAELLRNEINAALSEMGQAISEAEKRQVLIEILDTLC